MTEVAPGWSHFPHEPDIGIEGRGASIAEAFEQTALALTAIIVAPGDVLPRRSLRIACTAPNPELLLVEWLDALIFRMAVKRMLFARFEVAILGKGESLEAMAWGETLDPQRHHPGLELKGSTQTHLSVRREQGLWIARTVIHV